MQMEIDENEEEEEVEEERMEVDEEGEEEEGGGNNQSLANTSSSRSVRRHNSSNVSAASKQPPMNSYLHQKCFIGLPKLDEERIREFDMDELERDLEILESKRKKNRINLAIVIEYNQKVNKIKIIKYLNIIVESI